MTDGVEGSVFVVEVSSHESEELIASLAKEASNSFESYESRAFDGNTVVHIVIPVTVATVAIVRTWLISRVERGKAMSVVWKGMRLTGYNAKEVAEVMRAIEEGGTRGASDADKESEPPNKG